MAYSEAFLRDFFDLYKEQDCLWKIKAPSYHDKTARKRSMDILVAKFREVKNDADEDYVKKKINNFRTSYKRELKLVKNSIKSGAGSEDIYKPKLWYFELLSFLGDQDLPRTPISNMSDEEEATDQGSTQTEYVFSPPVEENEDLQMSDHSVLSTSISTQSKTPCHYKKRGRKTDPRDDLLITIHEKLNRPTADRQDKDRFSVFGDNVAMKLRALTNDQRIMAEKLINDVLFEAECNNLNRQWRLEPPSTTACLLNISQRPFSSNRTVIDGSTRIFQNPSNDKQFPAANNNYTELQQAPLVSNYTNLSASHLFQTFDADDNTL